MDTVRSQQPSIPQSLKKQSARVVAKHIRFHQNLVRLLGEIPLTLIRYIDKHYSKFCLEDAIKFDGYILKCPPPMVLDLLILREYKFHYNCIVYEELVDNDFYIRKFCLFCFKTYVKFKVPPVVREKVVWFKNYTILKRGIDIIENCGDYTCHHCHLTFITLVEEEEEERELLCAQSCTGLNTYLML